MSVRAALAIACLVGLQAAPGAQRGAVSTPDPHWVGTWATALVARAPRPPSPAPVGNPAPQPGRGGAAAQQPLVINNQTLRQIVHVSAGGDRVRVVFSNAFGTAPLAIGGAHVGLRSQDAALVERSGRALTFNGAPTATVPPGAVLFSDPAALTVPPMADLAIDLYFAGDVTGAASPLTIHAAARQTNYVSPAGNHAGALNMPVETTTLTWHFLARVEVAAPEGTPALVLFGDSITDGFNSTNNANNRWPDHLARRMKAAAGVLNLGIDGNRVLADGSGVSALARFDRDVISQTGATHLVLLEGINDLGMARQGPRPTVADLVGGHTQLLARAHAKGLKVIGATLLPYEGTVFPGYWSAEGEATRQQFNEWLRTGRAYDGVIDFDSVMRDPKAPTKLRPEFDSGDHLHPNDAGYRAMADAVDLALFRSDAAPARRRAIFAPHRFPNIGYATGQDAH